VGEHDHVPERDDGKGLVDFHSDPCRDGGLGDRGSLVLGPYELFGVIQLSQ
jgi:hypothetical protein